MATINQLCIEYAKTRVKKNLHFFSGLAEKCKSDKVRFFLKIEFCFSRVFPRTGANVS